MSEVAEALRAQTTELGSLLEELTEEEFELVTRCTPMTVADMVAHLAQIMHGLKETSQTEFDDEPSHTAATWYTYDPAEVGPRVIDGAREGSQGKTPQELTVWFREGAVGAVVAITNTSGRRIVGRDAPRRTRVTLDELARTRVLEAAVHTADIGHATKRGEAIVPAAAKVCCELLDEILGAKLPPDIGWDERTYILTATGRRPLSNNERWTLGELANRFPLIQ